MKKDQVIKTLKLLAEGIDPNTGEVMVKDRQYRSPTVIRALFNAINLLENPPTKSKRSREEINREQGLPRNAYKPWTTELDNLLKDMFEQKVPRREIAKRLERQTSAIRSRLEKLGLL